MCCISKLYLKTEVEHELGRVESCYPRAAPMHSTTEDGSLGHPSCLLLLLEHHQLVLQDSLRRARATQNLMGLPSHKVSHICSTRDQGVSWRWRQQVRQVTRPAPLPTTLRNSLQSHPPGVQHNICRPCTVCVVQFVEVACITD